ncbi:MAG: hypothetical protein ACI9UA_003944 [Pseudoalteromonas tetraodonis]|jgi:hypothetical protein
MGYSHSLVENLDLSGIGEGKFSDFDGCVG